MCGIAGYYCFGEARPSVAMVKALLIAQQTRGADAAGLAFPRGGKMVIAKAKGPAESFAKQLPDQLWEEVASSPLALLHARARTKGPEDNNNNNHPVGYGGWVVVHNGTVTNDDDWWEYVGKEKRFADVDTSAIPLALSYGKTRDESISYLSTIGGNCTIAAWSDAEPDAVLLWRQGQHELLLFVDTAKNILYWSSASVAGRFMPGALLGPLRFINMSKLPDEHCAVLKPDGLRLVKVPRSPFFAKRSYGGSTYSGGNSKLGVGALLTLTRSAPKEGEPERPVPRFPTEGFNWERYWNYTLREDVKAARAPISVVSCYGKWTLDKPNATVAYDSLTYNMNLAASFSPWDDVKVWFEAAYGEPMPSLPLAAADLAKWNPRIAGPEVLQSIWNGQTRVGCVCPLCGSWFPQSDWERDARCVACGLKPQGKAAGTDKVVYTFRVR